MQGGNQPKEKRSKYHEWAYVPKTKPVQQQPIVCIKRPSMDKAKQKQFAMKILHTLAKLEINIELMLIAVKNG
jgi:hypothetical protein